MSAHQPTKCAGGYSIVPLDDGRYAVESPRGYIYGTRYATFDLALAWIIERTGADWPHGRAIALRCRIGDEGRTTFGKVYLGVLTQKTHSGHVDTFMVQTDTPQAGYVCSPISASHFDPVLAKYDRHFIHRCGGTKKRPAVVTTARQLLDKINSKVTA